MKNLNVCVILVDGEKVKSTLVRNIISEMGISEQDVVESHVIVTTDDAAIDSFESKIILRDGSEIPIMNNLAVLQAATQNAPIVTGLYRTIAWHSPHNPSGIEDGKVCLLCMKNPFTLLDTLEEAVAKLHDLAEAVCKKGDEVFDRDTYQFSDGLFHDKDSQPRLLLKSIILKQGFAEIERLIFEEELVKTRWAFLIAAEAVDFLTANPIAAVGPGLLSLCNRLRNVFGWKSLDAIIAVAKGPGQDEGKG